MTNFFILFSAVWRLSSLLVEEHGPYQIFAKLRHRAGVRYDAYSRTYADNELGKLFVCVWCISIWVGALFTLLELIASKRRAWRFVKMSLALSAWAVLWETLISGARK